MKLVADGSPVERLSAELLQALDIDWVSIPSMPAFAADITGTWDRRTNRELVVATLVALLDDPDVRIVSGDMTRELTDAASLIESLDEVWPDDGSPIEQEIGWLVERDFELRQRDADAD